MTAHYYCPCTLQVYIAIAADANNSTQKSIQHISLPHCRASSPFAQEFFCYTQAEFLCHTKRRFGCNSMAKTAEIKALQGEISLEQNANQPTTSKQNRPIVLYKSDKLP